MILPGERKLGGGEEEEAEEEKGRGGGGAPWVETVWNGSVQIIDTVFSLIEAPPLIIAPPLIFQAELELDLKKKGNVLEF